MYMKRFPNSPIAYKKGFSIMVSQPADSKGITTKPYYYFDYDERSHSINMEFPHFHNAYEIFILLSPKAHFKIEGQTHNIINNDIIVVPPSVLHQSEYFPGEASSRIVINFSFPDEFMATNPVYHKLLAIFNSETPVLRFSPSIQDTVFAPLNELAHIAQLPFDSEVKNHMVHTKFAEFLFNIWRFLDKNSYRNQAEEGIKGKISAITAYIHNHYGDELTLELLAEEIHMNKFYLSHQFKEHTGYTIVQYIHLTRVSNAQFLLRNTTLKITEIADKTGFTSLSQFNRVFQKTCGLAPSRYRKGNIPPLTPQNTVTLLHS